MADYEDAKGVRQFADDMNRLGVESLEKFILQATNIAGIEVQKEARILSAIDTGAMRRSIQVGMSRIQNGVSAVIKPTEPYAYNIEFGQPAGTYVSPERLKGWAMRKGLNPYAVAKSIQKKGTRPQPFLFPAFESKEKSIILIISQGVENALNSLGKT